jgi:F-type H+-transporting ATPase subunit b
LINVNFTLLVQLANFLILLVILNYLLFKPILRILDDRDKLVRESSELKERLTNLAEENITEYESKLLGGKQEAMAIRTGLRNEALGEFRRIIQETKAGNVKELDRAKEVLSSETDRSREGLRAETGGLAGQIASKLLGRTPGGKA